MRSPDCGQSRTNSSANTEPTDLKSLVAIRPQNFLAIPMASESMMHSIIFTLKRCLILVVKRSLEATSITLLSRLMYMPISALALKKRMIHVRVIAVGYYFETVGL